MFDFTIPKYIFLIDTDSYAGNFERPLTAYCIGETGECGVGHSEAEEYAEDFPEEFDGGYLERDKYLCQVPDAHGCCRPCSIWPSEEGGHNSVAMFSYDKLPEGIEKRIKQRAEEYCKQNEIKVKGFRKLKVIFEIKEDV